MGYLAKSGFRRELSSEVAKSVRIQSVNRVFPLTLTIEHRIHVVRGSKVMLDKDLAELYQVPTKRLNEQVKRNVDRFPLDFLFQLATRQAFGKNRRPSAEMAPPRSHRQR